MFTPAAGTTPNFGTYSARAALDVVAPRTEGGRVHVGVWQHGVSLYGWKAGVATRASPRLAGQDGSVATPGTGRRRRSHGREVDLSECCCPAHGELCLRVPVLVNLPLELGQADLGSRKAGRGLTQVSRFPERGATCETTARQEQLGSCSR